ncbi:cysteine hydrolase family protein [Candidatus Korobacter versatilis]|nr:cysteine hydrolase family protein [Candidatus Koribacter versatilis]
MPKVAVVVIDVQEGILAGISRRRPEETERALDACVWRISELLKRARAAKVPVIYVQHEGGVGHRLEPGSAGFPIREEIQPKRGEVIVHKKFCDSFFETSLLDELKKLGAEQLVIAGCMTQYCIDTSTRRAVSVGFDVTLVADGHMCGDTRTLTFDQIIAHHNALLDGFDAGGKSVTVKPAAEIDFANASVATS